jgi:hypothetical protein
VNPDAHARPAAEDLPLPLAGTGGSPSSLDSVPSAAAPADQIAVGGKFLVIAPIEAVEHQEGALNSLSIGRPHRRARAP